jgi:hypothetical protein
LDRTRRHGLPSDRRPSSSWIPSCARILRKSAPILAGGVRALDFEPGTVDLASLFGNPDGWFGLLVLDGHLIVEVAAGRGHAGWLIGEGDLLRPWDLGDLPLDLGTRWRILTPVRIALLDRQFARRATGRATVVNSMLSHATRTTHWLLAKSLIVSCPRIDERLTLLFALLGERWGKVTCEGVRLRLPLTHEQLASLCGARRPSVTIALRQLVLQGIIERTSDRTWLLRRHGPEVLDAVSIRFGGCAQALSFGSPPGQPAPAATA